jgi:hypothetical protein
MTKQEELEKRVLMLEELCEQDIQDSAGNLDELAQAKKELKDFNKPELTPMQLDDLYEAIERGVMAFDFSDHDNYEKDFELDYDSRVQLSNFDLINHQDLVEEIVARVNKLFIEATCLEELDTTEPDNHA